MMAKVHPKTTSMVNASSNSEYLSSERETFTVWMKSLVINSNGCTVFNSKGEIVFRVDNYQTRRSREVLLMNLNGQVLFSIKTKKLLGFRSTWEGHKLVNSKFDEQCECFKVKRESKLFGRGITSCHVDLGCNKNIVGLMQGKSILKIMDCDGRVLAEVMQKQLLAGVCLGDDVLSLTMEPHIDQSLIVALVVVYGLINNKL